MSHILHRQLRGTLARRGRGRGITIVDRQGQANTSTRRAAPRCPASATAIPTCCAAMHAQIDKLAYAHTSFFTTEVAEELADHLIAHAPPGISHVYLVSGGSEAIEAALKLARQYFVEIGQPERTPFHRPAPELPRQHARRARGRRQCVAAAPVRAAADRRDARVAVLRIPRPARRRDRPRTTANGWRASSRTRSRELGPADRHRALCAETVGGATSGAMPPVPGYFRRVREICDRHGILLHRRRSDVRHGPHRHALRGRAGRRRAGSGARSPRVWAAATSRSARVLVQQRIVDALAGGSGFFQHGHTYLGHPVACAAALAVQQVIERDGLLDAVKALGARLQRSACRRRFGRSRARRRHPRPRPVHGDRAGRRPADEASVRSGAALHARIKAEAMARGLMVYPMGGTIDGRAGDHVLLAPPFITTPAEIDEIVRSPRRGGRRRARRGRRECPQ